MLLAFFTKALKHRKSYTRFRRSFGAQAHTGSKHEMELSLLHAGTILGTTLKILMALASQSRNDLVIPTEKNELIKQIIESLHLFETVTTELFAERNVSASKIIPLARGLQKFTASDNNMTPFHQELVLQMATRFIGIEEKYVTAIATLMDPRFKKIPFTSDGTVERMKQRIISDASALAASGPEPPTECSRYSKWWR